MELLSLQLLVIFAVFGTCAGCAAGLLGIGGGVILVPLFMWSFQLAGLDPQILVHCAFATSLAIIIPTAISNTLGHRKRGYVRGTQVLYLALGALCGACVGAWCASLLSGSFLKVAFGVMQIAVAFKLLSGALKPANEELREQRSLLLLTGFVGGAFSSFFGVGGGVVAVPFMVILLHFPIHLAVGNSTALIVVSSFVGTCAYIYTGWGLRPITDGFLGYVFLPAVAMVIPFSLVGSRIGVHLAGHFSHVRMIKIFAALLVCVGVRVIWVAF